ncbi:transglutaminase family protein, partial [Actinocorallia lasiicapitis]
MSTRPGLTAIAATATLLGSISLYPLFLGWAWLPPGAGAIAVVAATGLLVRRYRLPAALNMVCALAALNLYLTLLYTGSKALLLIVPTPASLAEMESLLRQGWQTAETFAAPLPDIEAVRLMSTLGIGLTAAVVDLIAVRLRRAAPAGLPLLAMYSVPAAVRTESVHWAAFAAGSAGYLAMLVADARDQVTSWGRPVFTRRWNERETGEQADARPITSAGRRVGLAAIALAVVVPAILPGISPAGMFGLGGEGRGGGGSTTITTADPLVDLKRRLVQLRDQQVLTYRTTAARPDYLRMFALDKFDGNHWTYSALVTKNAPQVRNGDLPAPTGTIGVPTDRVTTEITVSPKVREMNFLPVPYAPVKLDIDGDDWRADLASLMLFSGNAATEAGGKTFTVVSDRALPTAPQLEQASRPDISGYLDTPARLPESIRSLTRQLVKGKESRYARALAIQDYFLDNFTYSLDPPPPSRVGHLESFLRDKRGYCEQFAATMALMARLADIPARVAVGFAPGTVLPDGRYEVRQKDSHAWPELYFAGSGWVRFEPTPGGSGRPSLVDVPSYAQPPAEERPSGASRSASASPTPGA